MRWFWIDRFSEFESGRYATSVKNVSLAEEHLHDHLPGAPIMPNSLIIEGLAQTGGLLVAEQGNWEERVVLGKISKATFHFHAVPGDTLNYRAEILDFNKDGALIRGTSHVAGRLQAEMDIYFVHIDENFAGKSLFEPVAFLSLLRMLGVFEVGRTADGARLTVPEALERQEREFHVDEVVD